jgi:hypothetical protein
MELTEIVRRLEPRLIETLSSLHITFDGSRAEAKLSFELFGPPGLWKHMGPVRPPSIQTTCQKRLACMALNAIRIAW